MYNTSFIKKILLAATAVFLYSCDKDFNAIGGDLIGDDHFGLESVKYDVLSYNQEVTSVQSNILPTSALGIYTNPVFGETTANYVTQVALAAYAPSIGEDPVIESAVLSVPYFSHITANNADGSHTYELDSIYGPVNGKLKLSVYESGYQMRSSYPSNGIELPQYYYTSQNSTFDQAKAGNRLNDDTTKPFQNDQFFFSAEEYKAVTKDSNDKETTTYTAPEMRLNLNSAFFQDRILKAPASKIASNDVFQEYFRGLYFKVEKADGSPANMALMDFSKGKITITYKAKTDSTTDAPETTEERTIVINFVNPTSSGGTANLLQDAKSAAYSDAISSSDVNKKTEGEERLYLKGGQGSAAVIKLSGFAAQIKDIRAKNWKVNEANLVFNIDSDKMTGADEPKRIYLYDLTNNVPLADYYADQTTSLTAGDTKGAKYVFGGIINLGDNKRGKTYKIRITEYIRNLIKDETAKNVDLGLVVTESIGIVSSNFLENRIVLQPNEYFSQVPRASIMNPLGTILFGNNIPDGDPNYDKRLRLEVYYTKPN